MPGKQSHIPHSQTQTHKKFSWVRGVLILAAVLLILVGTTIGIIEGSLANNLSLLLNALGVIFTFLLAFSVYRNPMPLEAAQTLIDLASQVSQEQVGLAVQTLCLQHLLQPAGGERYQIHAIVTDYAHNHYDDDSEQANQQASHALHAKAARYYQRQATSLCPPREQRRRMSHVQPLIEAVWHFCQAEQWREAFALMEQEDLFESLRKWGENGLLLELCLLIQSQTKWDLAPLQAALLYSSLAWAYNAGGKRKQAREYLEQALRLYRENGDRKGESHALSALGWSYLVRGQARQADFYYQQALQISEDIGDRKGESFNLNCLGWVSSILGHKLRALEYFTHALGICQTMGDSMGKGRALHSLGRIHLDIGKYKQAMEYLEQAIAIRREAGHRRNEGAVLSQMGRGYRLQKQWTDALSCLEQGLNISKETGDRGLEAHVLYHMGLVYSDTGQYDRAQELLEQGLYLCKEVEDRHREGRVTNSLGKVYAALGKSEQAIALYQQALFIAREVEDQWCEGTALQHLGMYFFKRNNYASAAACFLLAQQRLEEVQSPDAQEAQAALRELHDTIGEMQYSAVLVEVEPQAQLVVDHALDWELAKEEMQ